MRISATEEYLGDCGRCQKKWANPATTTVWMEFKTPIPARPELDLPEYKGVWESVCNDCLRDNDILQKE